MTMNWDRIEGGWKQMSGKVQQQWGKLTNDDLDVVNGKSWLARSSPAMASPRTKPKSSWRISKPSSEFEARLWQQAVRETRRW
jgi:hypothetical protein